MKKTKLLITTAMLAALICVATVVIQIPSVSGGYINLGDPIILFASAFLPPIYSFVAAAVGSALADLLSGFVLYAPATFVIKGLMALVSYGVFALISRSHKVSFTRIFSSVAAECVMILGYFTFEGFIYGFGASLVNIPANAVQGAVGVILGSLLINIFKRYDLFK